MFIYNSSIINKRNSTRAYWYFYTNYSAKWCIDYAYEQIEKVSLEYPLDHKRIIEKVKLSDAELQELKEQAIRLLRDASELRLGDYKDTHHKLPIVYATGGFEAKAWCDKDKTQIIGLELKFILTSWDSEIDEDEED